MKVLIWDNFQLQNTGGPSGYLYNIHEYLKDHPNKNITFLSDLIKNNTTSRPEAEHTYSQKESNTITQNKLSLYKRTWHSILKLFSQIPSVKSFLTKTIDYTYRIYNIKWNIKGLESIAKLNEYDFIHFHFLIHVKQFKNTFPCYTGKTIVTSHSPSPWTVETIDNDPSVKWLKPIMIRKE